jgi:hypothetical protein
MTKEHLFVNPELPPPAASKNTRKDTVKASWARKLKITAFCALGGLLFDYWPKPEHVGIGGNPSYLIKVSKTLAERTCRL